MSQEHASIRRVRQWWLMHTRQGLTVNIISDAVYLVYGTIFILSHAVLPFYRNLLWDV